VDVPGLGFASTNNSNPDGWKNVIDRYISVRENLKLVFHLVDSKVGITAVDEQV
jgi:GTP-binding protein